MIALLPLLLAAATCPPGTTARGAAPPAGLHRWCEDAAGRKHGPEREWYAPGKPKAEGSWEAGQMHGAWKAWREDGTLFMDEAYARGEPVAATGGKPAAPKKSGSWGMDLIAEQKAKNGGKPLIPAPAGAAPLFDPSRHPKAGELRAYVRSLGSAAAAEAEAATKMLFDQSERLTKISGGTSRRWSEGEHRYLANVRPDNATRVLIDLETQLWITHVVDRAAKTCKQILAHPDPTGQQRKLIEESTPIDCAALAGDRDLGPAVAALRGP